MNTKGSNRSVLRTKKLLKDGLSELMEKKRVSEITVKELTELVNLNRGTFYLHYKDIFDLLDEMENEMLETFYSIAETYTPEQLNGKPFPLLKDIFLCVGQNANFCRALLIENKNQSFVDKLKNIMKEKCFYDWDYLFATKNPENYELFFSYIASGCIGILENWLLSGMKQSAKEIASFAEDIILHGTASLEK